MFFKLLKDAFKIKQVRSKILFTIFIILVFRIGTTITVPGVNAKSLEAFSICARGEPIYHSFHRGATPSNGFVTEVC